MAKKSEVNLISSIPHWLPHKSNSSFYLCCSRCKEKSTPEGSEYLYGKPLMALFGHRKLCRLAMSFPKVLDVAAGAYKPWTAWV